MSADDDVGLLPIGPQERRPVPDPTVLTLSTIRREIELVREALDRDQVAYRQLLENKFRAIHKQFDVLEHMRVELKTDRTRELAESHTTQNELLTRMREFTDMRTNFVREELKEAVAQQKREVDSSILAQRNLNDSMFDKISMQIQMSNQQRDEQKHDAERGVETARLQAQQALSDFMERYQRAHEELYEQTEKALDIYRRQVEEKFQASEKLIAQQQAASERAINKSEAATAEQLKLLSQPISDLKDRVGAIEAMRLGATESRTEIRESKTDSRGNIAIWIAAASVLVTIVFMVYENMVRTLGH